MTLHIKLNKPCPLFYDEEGKEVSSHYNSYGRLYNSSPSGGAALLESLYDSVLERIYDLHMKLF